MKKKWKYVTLLAYLHLLFVFVAVLLHWFYAARPERFLLSFLGEARLQLEAVQQICFFIIIIIIMERSVWRPCSSAFIEPVSEAPPPSV